MIRILPVFSMYGIVFGIGTILNDRQYKTWQRMMIAPVSKAAILGGSMTVTFVRDCSNWLSCACGEISAFDRLGEQHHGKAPDRPGFVFSITSLGLLLSGIVKTSAQLAAVTPVLAYQHFHAGGCMWPLICEQ
jgi:ABC-2 type transport system permease protein